ncbi:hypothetical protein MAM1_0057d03657 [Mucor ambiguus]|uniref:Uncharacterized protein n=1 Tax=Mucor ambiguus TaxID=91626 RepID=A0A0C9MM40_9FUNG|nr:hypothetical protein MAM1_0057d03657 [Mucor ambiguus]
MISSNISNSAHTWNNLPSLELCNILQYAQQSSNPILQKNEPFLGACQLVCKGWSKAAQKALYKQVALGSNAIRFLNTITEAKKLGDFVKILIVKDDIADLGDIFDILEDIITRCPYIEELYSFDQVFRNDVWTYLTSAKKVPQHLKAIAMTTSDAASSPLYPAMAIRFEETLTRMQICFNTALASNAEQGSHSLLSKRLSHFVSLQQLRVDHWRVESWQDFDTLINRCSTTLRELILTHLDLSNDKFPQTYAINCNTNVTLLKIGASNVAAATLKYLKSKLVVLERFDLLFVTFPDDSLQDTDVWWAYLMEVCMNLISYNVKFAHFNYQDIYQLRNCMKLSTATTTHWKDAKHKTASLSFNRPQDKDNVISLSKARHKYTIYLEYDKVDYLDYIMQWTQMYSPHYIRIQGGSVESQYQKITFINTAQIQKVTAVGAKSLLGQITNKSNLHIFITVLSFIAGKNVSTLQFDSMVLYYNYSLGNSTLKNLQVSNLKLTNSILQHRVLECVSKMFVKIEKLTLDTCCILMDNPFQLNIYLPFTEMVTLELIINPFVNATSWSPYKKHIYSECCSLENLDLLRAVSKYGHFMVKIETQDTTHVFHKQGDGDIEKSSVNPNHVEGNAFNFAFLIKGKQLDEGTHEQSTVCNVSFEDEDDGDAVDIKADYNGIANAVEAKVTNGHVEQETIDQMMLPYPQMQNTAKFGHI